MKKIRPFVPQEQEWMIVDNALFDHIMPSLSPNAWKVLCFILRKTEGWHKEWDGLSYTQIMKGTSIKSSATVSKAIKELLDQDFIKRVQTPEKWDSNRYALNLALEIEVDNGSALENEVEPNLDSKVESSLESKDTKEQHENTGKEQSTLQDFNIGQTNPLDGVPQATDGHQQAIDVASGGNGTNPVKEVAKHLRYLCDGRNMEFPESAKGQAPYIKAAQDLLARTDATDDWQTLCAAIDDWSENPPADDKWWRDKTKKPSYPVDHLVTHYGQYKENGKVRALAQAQPGPLPEFVTS